MLYEEYLPSALQANEFNTEEMVFQITPLNLSIFLRITVVGLLLIQLLWRKPFSSAEIKEPLQLE